MTPEMKEQLSSLNRAIFVHNGDEAAVIYKAVLAAQPDFLLRGPVQYDLAQLLQKSNHRDLALKAYSAIIERQKDNKAMTPALKAAGITAFELKQFDKCVEYLTAFLDTKPMMAERQEAEELLSRLPPDQQARMRSGGEVKLDEIPSSWSPGGSPKPVVYDWKIDSGRAKAIAEKSTRPVVAPKAEPDSISLEGFAAAPVPGVTSDEPTFYGNAAPAPPPPPKPSVPVAMPKPAAPPPRQGGPVRPAHMNAALGLDPAPPAAQPLPPTTPDLPSVGTDPSIPLGYAAAPPAYYPPPPGYVPPQGGWAQPPAYPVPPYIPPGFGPPPPGYPAGPPAGYPQPTPGYPQHQAAPPFAPAPPPPPPTEPALPVVAAAHLAPAPFIPEPVPPTIPDVLPETSRIDRAKLAAAPAPAPVAAAPVPVPVAPIAPAPSPTARPTAPPPVRPAPAAAASAAVESPQERYDRLSAARFALMLPVGQRIHLEAVAELVSRYDDIPEPDAKKKVLRGKGLIYDELDINDLATLQPMLKRCRQSLTLVHVPKGLMGFESHLVSAAEVRDQGIKMTCDGAVRRLRWEDVKLVNCGILGTDVVALILGGDPMREYRFKSGVFNYASFSPKGIADFRLGVVEFIDVLAERAPKAARSNIAEGVLIRKLSTPQAFPTAEEFDSYCRWVVYTHLAETVNLDELMDCHQGSSNW